MTRAEYNLLEGANFSTLKMLLRSPAHYQAAVTAKRDEKDEDRIQLLIGSAVHSMVLEGRNVRDLYAIKPEGMNLATKEGKAWKAEQTCPILDAETVEQVERMSESVLSDPMARAIFEMCPEREVGLQAQIGSVLCKGLLDALGRDKSGTGIVPDLKTTQDARAFKFRAKVLWDFHYDFQAALYCALARETDRGECVPLWVVVETTPPYAVIVYRPGAELLASGQRKLDQVLRLYEECSASSEWWGYQRNPTIQEL